MLNKNTANIILSDALLGGLASLLLIWLIAISRSPVETPIPGTNIQENFYAISLISAKTNGHQQKKFNIEKHLGCILYEYSETQSDIVGRFSGTNATNVGGQIGWPNSSVILSGRESIIFTLEEDLEPAGLAAAIYLRDYEGLCLLSQLSNTEVVVELKNMKVGQALGTLSLSIDNNFFATVTLETGKRLDLSTDELLVSASAVDIIQNYMTDFNPLESVGERAAYWRKPFGLEFFLEHTHSPRHRRTTIESQSIGITFVDDIPGKLPTGFILSLNGILKNADAMNLKGPVFVGMNGAAVLEKSDSGFEWKVFLIGESKIASFHIDFENLGYPGLLDMQSATRLAAISVLSGFESNGHDVGAFYQNPLILIGPPVFEQE